MNYLKGEWKISQNKLWTKYVNLKYDNNQYGGRNEFVCLPDSEGKYSTYDKCNTVRNVSFESNEDAPNPMFADFTIAKIKEYMSFNGIPLSAKHKEDWEIDIRWLFNTYSLHKIAKACNTSDKYLILTGATKRCAICNKLVPKNICMINVNELYFHAVCPP